MADGQQEPVAALPIRIFWPVAHRVEVGHGQHIRHAERLADIALALHLAHAERIAADAIGAFGQADIRARSGGGFAHASMLLLRAAQWMSMPPFTSITAPVT